MDHLPVGKRPAMSQKKDPNQPESGKRFRDFLVLTSGGVGVLALLYLTGAIGLVEWMTAAIVMIAGALAFYVGSASSPGASPRAAVLDAPPVSQPPEHDQAIASFIHAPPLPALLIASGRQITAINTHARSLFRFDVAERSIPAAMLRQPDLLAATARVEQ